MRGRAPQRGCRRPAVAIVSVTFTERLMSHLRPSPARCLRAAVCAVSLALAAACASQNGASATSDSAASRASQVAAPLPPVHHVFLIVLENKNFDATFGKSSEAPYLADTLARQGALLTQYYGVGHYSLDNYIAMTSGQAPNKQTQGDCGRFEDFVETGMAAHGQVAGQGCVFPAHVLNIANQLEQKGLRWKGYMEDMGNDPAREAATCGHPHIGDPDRTQGAQKESAGHPLDQYATKHNPFMYFHSIIDAPSCDSNVVSFATLESDLASATPMANYVFITPNLCSDGHDSHCASGRTGGLVAINEFLRAWVPRILASPSFKDGLLIITFDEAQAIDASACCNEQPGPNAARPGVIGPGGGRIGAVLLSPFIAPGTVSNVPYNHYSMLRSVEDLFGLTPHLGFAAQEELRSFGSDVFR
jgi:hypothetical protein